MTQKPPKSSSKIDEESMETRTFSRKGNTSLPTFVARCEPPRSGEGTNGSRRLSVFVGQRLRSHGVEQVWDTIIVHCDEDSEGTLSAVVVISNPDWDERLQIAHLRSRPADPHALTALGCNLDHRRTHS
jgi:hypothetical protein